jgi:hypothetical protein
MDVKKDVQYLRTQAQHVAAAISYYCRIHNDELPAEHKAMLKEAEAECIQAAHKPIELTGGEQGPVNVDLGPTQSSDTPAAHADPLAGLVRS